MAGRAGQSLPVGNEGAGVVVKAGSSPHAQALLGKTVAVLGGAMYAQYRTIKASRVPGAAARHHGGGRRLVFRQSADRALGMVETMRREGHKALVHTAAASNLGQMLNKICLADGVRWSTSCATPEQARMLRAVGATHVVDSDGAQLS